MATLLHLSFVNYSRSTDEFISSVLLCLYLVNIEVTIVSTALVTITDDLLSFEKTSWVVTGYLITYTGMYYPSYLPYFSYDIRHTKV